MGRGEGPPKVRRAAGRTARAKWAIAGRGERRKEASGRAEDPDLRLLKTPAPTDSTRVRRDWASGEVDGAACGFEVGWAETLDLTARMNLEAPPRRGGAATRVHAWEK